jgi:hypothetical protein
MGALVAPSAGAAGMPSTLPEDSCSGSKYLESFASKDFPRVEFPKTRLSIMLLLFITASWRLALPVPLLFELSEDALPRFCELSALPMLAMSLAMPLAFILMAMPEPLV